MSPAPGARWLVTGARGQLGTALVRELLARGAHVEARGRELDITRAAEVDRAIASLAAQGPCAVVNAAAMTQVDRCEREPDPARRVNGEAPAALAEACLRHGAGLVHVSTDYVFDGEASQPYRETDAPAPRSVYGRTKLAGERAVLEASPRFLVVRTSWVFGRGRNFVAAILARAYAGEALRVVDDQVGRPTYATDLARGILALLDASATGLYHLTNRGVASWWELARACLDHRGLAHVPIERIRTSDLQLDAPRPRHSVLDCGKAEQRGVVLRSWREALAEHLGSEDAPRRAQPEGATSACETRP